MRSHAIRRGGGVCKNIEISLMLYFVFVIVDFVMCQVPVCRPVKGKKIFVTCDFFLHICAIICL